MAKILIVDDSAFMRQSLSAVIKTDSELTVAGTAFDIPSAVSQIKKLDPDIILLGIGLPECAPQDSYLASFKDILKEKNIPVIVLTPVTKKASETTFDLLENGATDFVIFPEGDRKEAINKISQELITKLKVAVKLKPKKFAPLKKISISAFHPTTKKIVVVASSTGGPQTLEAFLTQLPANIPAPILIVQHMPPIFTNSLAKRLDNLCEIEIREAKDGDEIKQGVALIAPGGYHMELKADLPGYEGAICLNEEPPELGVRPNANRLFKSVAPIFKENTIGIVLTGMGNDGTEGSRAIKSVGGTVIAEAEESCIIYGMPKSVVDNQLADMVVSLDKMGVALLQLLDI